MYNFFGIEEFLKPKDLVWMEVSIPNWIYCKKINDSNSFWSRQNEDAIKSGAWPWYTLIFGLQVVKPIDLLLRIRVLNSLRVIGQRKPFCSKSQFFCLFWIFMSETSGILGYQFLKFSL